MIRIAAVNRITTRVRVLLNAFNRICSGVFFLYVLLQACGNFSSSVCERLQLPASRASRQHRFVPYRPGFFHRLPQDRCQGCFIHRFAFSGQDIASSTAVLAAVNQCAVAGYPSPALSSTRSSGTSSALQFHGVAFTQDRCRRAQQSLSAV